MPITSPDNPKFKAYAELVFRNEGTMDDDPRDHAVACVSNLPAAQVAKRGKYGRPIHTVKGITWCNFQADAAKLGITPVTHARFVAMNLNDATKFLFNTYKGFPWANTKDAVGIIITECAWGSGEGRVWPTIIDTLKLLNRPSVVKRRNNFNYTRAEKQTLINEVNKIPEKAFFNAFHTVRYNFLDRLGQTAYGRVYRKGWLRRTNELKKLGDDVLLKGNDLATGPFFFWPW